MGGRGLEPPTPSLSSKGTCNPTGETKALAPTPSAACIAACTSEAENANGDAPKAASLDSSPEAADRLDTGPDTQAAAVADQGDEGERTDQGDPLAVLAAELAKLSPADRERLAAMLAER